MPEAPVVERAPLNVAVPVILEPAMDAALIAAVVRLLAPVIERAASGVVPPSAPLN